MNCPRKIRTDKKDDLVSNIIFIQVRILPDMLIFREK